MTNPQPFTLSIIVPVFNEAAGVEAFHLSLTNVLETLDMASYEIIYCDDGSTDGTAGVVRTIHATNPQVRLVSLSRNFGKEYALTAGIHQAKGDAIITIDGDGQHPVDRIPAFIEAWQDGAQVVVGLRKRASSSSNLKGLRSKLFYSLFNKITGVKLVPGASDFRLIDAEVQQVFNTLPETDRITRGLIDWLGFKQATVQFTVRSRDFGTATYSSRQLIRLAVNSFVSLSPAPLYIFGYIGVVITFLSALLGVTVSIEQLLLRDPMGWKFSGTAFLAIGLLFLVGIILISQGILSLYVSRIHNQTKQRPLYIINKAHSIGVDQK